LCCEALGAVPVLSLSGARVKEPPYRRAEELPDRLKAETERLTAMLSAVELLAGEGNCVAYNIEGPFTLLCSLLPMNRVFSALRKEEGVKLLEKAESWVCDYAALAVGRGVRLLSFADPVAAVDILGEKMFSSVYVPSLKRVLDRLRSEFPDTPIHLCGKLSQCLLDTRFCTAERRESEGRCASYGEALSSFCETGQNGVIGHFCLNYLKAKRTYLTLLEL